MTPSLHASRICSFRSFGTFQPWKTNSTFGPSLIRRVAQPLSPPVSCRLRFELPSDLLLQTFFRVECVLSQRRKSRRSFLFLNPQRLPVASESGGYRPKIE